MNSLKQSPEYVRCSTAAAMTLGLKPGWFWRGTKPHCINLLLSYEEGCAAACAYCGLSRLSKRDDTFIRVAWPTYALREILDKIGSCAQARRVCLSMITHALALLEGRRLRSIVFVLLMPLPGCDLGRPAAPWDLDALQSIFEKARATFPTTPLLLGCARPAGLLQKQIDVLAIEAGFDGIAFPSEGAAAHALRIGRPHRFSEFCCSLMM